MVIKNFKYKGYKITIRSFRDSWDKKIIIRKGKLSVVYMYNLKHISDAIKQAKKIVNHIIKQKI